jgi:hypothetical protein
LRLWLATQALSSLFEDRIADPAAHLFAEKLKGFGETGITYAPQMFVEVHFFWK